MHQIDNFLDHANALVAADGKPGPTYWRSATSSAAKPRITRKIHTRGTRPGPSYNRRENPSCEKPTYSHRNGLVRAENERNDTSKRPSRRSPVTAFPFPSLPPLGRSEACSSTRSSLHGTHTQKSAVRDSVRFAERSRSPSKSPDHA